MSESWPRSLRKAICQYTRAGGARSAGAGLLVVVLTLIVGCSSDTKKWQVVMTPTATLNQDDAGSSLPVVVRVYQLKAKDKFQQATFKTLWKNDKEVLEGDLLERKEVTIHPETKTVLDIDLDVKHGAAFIGVMGLFRKPDVDGWKQLAAAESSAFNPFTPKVKLILDRNMIKPQD